MKTKLKIPPKSEFFRIKNKKIEFRSPRVWFEIESLGFKRGKKLIAITAVYEWQQFMENECRLNDDIELLNEADRIYRKIKCWKKWGGL